MIIREACAEDAEQIIAYTKIIGQESDNLSFGEDGLPITIEQEVDFLKQVHEDKTSVHFIACEDDEIIGNASLSGMPRRMSHRAEVALSVKRKYWNRGVGSALMNVLIQYAKENGIEILNLEVRSDNISAIHVYEKFGFKHIGTSPAFFKIDGTYVDFTLMYLDLR